MKCPDQLKWMDMQAGLSLYCLGTFFSYIYVVHLFLSASLHIACVIQQRDLKQWFAELSVDMDKVYEDSSR